MLTKEEIQVALDRAKVYPAGVSTTCWFWDQPSGDDEDINNEDTAIFRVTNKINLDSG